MNMLRIRRTAIPIGAIVTLLLGLSVTGDAAPSGHNDATAEDVQKEAQDLVQVLKSYSANQRDEALEKTRLALEELDRIADNLQARIDDRWEYMGTTAREQARATMRSLRKQRNQVAQWYGSMKTSTVDAWAEMKQGFSEAYATLREASKKAQAEYQSESSTATSASS